MSILWTGPNVISETITVGDVERVESVVGHPVVLWDNLHANDYDNGRRLYLGPYWCGVSLCMHVSPPPQLLFTALHARRVQHLLSFLSATACTAVFGCGCFNPVAASRRWYGGCTASSVIPTASTKPTSCRCERCAYWLGSLRAVCGGAAWVLCSSLLLFSSFFFSLSGGC